MTLLPPTTAGAGDIIQITGCNFGSSQGSSTVKINGTSVGAAGTWQQGYISFTMPTGLSSGNLVVRVSGVDTGAISFTVTQPAITSISPTSGAPGLHVTITGSHFGSSQGSVTFYNGQNASIYSWNSTQIVAIAPSGVATGNVTATVGGVQTNAATFTAVAPPTATSSVFPAANGAGWQNMNVTVTYTCTAGGLALASCSSPQVVSSEGLNQTVTGGATDVNGDVANTSVTLSIDKTKPTLTISSPADGDSTSSSSITVSGTLSDALSGTDGVTCNGTSTTLSSGAFSCNISLNVGVNLLVIRGTDIAGNVAAANYHITRTGSYSTTTSLQVSPAVVNMVVGDTQQFSLADQDGHVRTDATWAVDDTDKATLPDANTPTLTAASTGDVTLTATIGSTTASATIHILSGTSLTDGTVRWSAPSTSGYTVQQIVQAVPSAGGPDLFSVETDGTNSMIRALSADGQQLWTKQISGWGVYSYGMNSAFPDGNGGIMLRAVPVGTTETLTDYDAQTGAQLWSRTSGRDNAAELGEQRVAIMATGDVYHAEQLNGRQVLSILDHNTGVPTAQYQIPQGTRNQCGYITPLDTSLTRPSIDPDGNALMLIEVYNQVASCGTALDEKTISLLRMTPDGSVTLTQIDDEMGIHKFPQINGPTLAIPDGAGGALASWWLPEFGPPDNPTVMGETHIAHITAGSAVSDYQFTYHGGPFYEMVLGDPDTGLAYGCDLASIVAFSISSGDVAWSYDASSYNGGAHIIASTAEGGLVAKVTDENNVETVVRFDSEGTPTSDEWTATQIDYDLSAMWVGTSGNQFASFAGGLIDWAKSIWSAPAQQGTNAPVAKVPLRVAVIKDTNGADVAGSTYIHGVVDGAVSLWQKRARILLDWNSQIDSFPACISTCSPNIETDLTSMFDPVFDQGNNNATVQAARTRFGSASGIQAVFVNVASTPVGTAGGYTMYHAANNQQIFENIVFVTSVGSHQADANGQVLAHEIGHTFQLSHKPFAAVNLMCGSTSSNWFLSGLELFPCDSGISLWLTPSQVRDAQKGAKAWELP